jgi:hypothetical protein
VLSDNYNVRIDDDYIAPSMRLDDTWMRKEQPAAEHNDESSKPNERSPMRGSARP